jgi:hypothetical protein
MKLLLPFLLLLAGCSTDSDPMHAAVSGYIKKNLGEPDSYTSVRWGKATSFQQRQADSLAAIALLPSYQAQATRAQQGLDSLRDESVETGSDWEKSIKYRMLVAAERADSLAAIGQRLKDSQDTTRIGVVQLHAFRAKNKMGAIVLDSAHFLVYENGRVKVI